MNEVVAYILSTSALGVAFFTLGTVQRRLAFCSAFPSALSSRLRFPRDDRIIQCSMVDHRFIEAEVEFHINQACQQLSDQGHEVTKVEVFFKPESGNYSSLIVYKKS